MSLPLFSSTKSFVDGLDGFEGLNNRLHSTLILAGARECRELTELVFSNDGGYGFSKLEAAGEIFRTFTLLARDCGLCLKSQFALALFHPVTDRLGNSGLEADIRAIVGKLQLLVCRDVAIRVSYSFWYNVISWWVTKAVELNAFVLKNLESSCAGNRLYRRAIIRTRGYSIALKQLETLLADVEDGYDNTSRMYMLESIIEESKSPLPPSGKRLAYFLLTGYVPSRLIV